MGLPQAFSKAWMTSSTLYKEQQPRIEEQTFDNLCTMRLAIRESRAAELIEKLRKAGGSVRDEAE